MNKERRTLTCPICKAIHIVPMGNNRSKCKGCSTWLQINEAGDALQDYFVAKSKAYLQKKGYSAVTN